MKNKFQNVKECSVIFMLVTILMTFVYTPKVNAGEPVCHLLLCCRNMNQGATWLINGEWQVNHDYNDINTVRDILQKVKDAGINTVSIDMTNPSMWHAEQQRDFHIPMCDNIRQVCAEKGMKYIIFIGGQIEYCLQSLIDDGVPGVYAGMAGVEYWNMIAEEIVGWKDSDSHYKKYGYDGDNRPILQVFLPGDWWWNEYNNAPFEHKNNLEEFWIGTHEINETIDNPLDSDGWGYRNDNQNTDGSIRYSSPNMAENPDDWGNLSPFEFRKHVQWVKAASKYSIYGSYDDVCDEINWGISDTKNSTNTSNLYPAHIPTVYYNIIQEELVGCPAPAGENDGEGLLAKYYNNTDFSGTPELERLEKKIHVNFGAGSPGPGVKADFFCVEITGKIEVPYSGYYTFFGNADNCEGLVIDGHIIFRAEGYDDENLGTVPVRLDAGQKYDITYKMNKKRTGDAEMKLEWETACLSRDVVPQSRFYTQ